MTIIRAIRAGVSVHEVAGISQKRVRPILDTAIQRFQQSGNLSRESGNASAPLAERKTVDKAKGILMRQRGMSEDEAYAAMRSNQLPVDIAKSIVPAASLLIASLGNQAGSGRHSARLLSWPQRLGASSSRLHWRSSSARGAIAHPPGQAALAHWKLHNALKVDARDVEQIEPHGAATGHARG